MFVDPARKGGGAFRAIPQLRHRRSDFAYRERGGSTVVAALRLRWCRSGAAADEPVVTSWEKSFAAEIWSTAEAAPGHRARAAERGQRGECAGVEHRTPGRAAWRDRALLSLLLPAELGGDHHQVRCRRRAGCMPARTPIPTAPARRRPGGPPRRMRSHRPRVAASPEAVRPCSRSPRAAISFCAAAIEPENVDLHQRPTALLAFVRRRRGPAQSAYRPPESTSPPARRGSRAAPSDTRHRCTP